MNYFTSLTDWILAPLKDYNINFATLNIDQAIDLHSDRHELSKAILDDHTAHWLGRLFDKIQQQDYLAKQDEFSLAESKASYLLLKDLKSMHKIKNKTFDFVFTFISDKEKFENNMFFQEVKKACISDNVHPNFHSAQLMEIAGRNVEFDRGESCTLVFPLKHEPEFSYDNISGNYIAYLLSVQISSITNIKDKNILISFAFLKGLQKTEKKRFFRALIRSLLQVYYQTYRIIFERITILVDSEADIRLLNSAIDDLIQLLDYNSSIIDWWDFYSKHPLNAESKNKIYMEIEYGYNRLPNALVENSQSKTKKIVSPTGTLANEILNEVSTTDENFIKELQVIEKILDYDDSILILGETGVGKSFLAEKIHYASNRSKENFRLLNCSAFPETLIESELFGWEKGAHKDATGVRYGYIEQANKGTLFIDEVGKASLSIQQKLLTFLDTKMIFRLGGKSPVEIDARIIFASNDSLQTLIKQGKLLPEFYHRIATFPITIPPLRKRPDDIEKFILKFNNEYEEKFKWKLNITDHLNYLKSQPWYGNLRELKATIQLMVVFSSINEQSIKQSDLEEILERVNIDKGISGISNLDSLEHSILEYFKKWLNHKNEIQDEVIKIYKRFGMKGPSDNQKSFAGSVIIPMLAKIFQENKEFLGLDQRDASKSIGISWSGTRENSTLVQKLNLYPVVEKYFND